MVTTDVDVYLAEGCGRCAFFQTPQCKVHLWTDGLVGLRELLGATELVETMKWGSPCYTYEGGNVVMITAFRDSFALSFLRGSLMADPDGVLEMPGPNSQIMRLLRFRDVADVAARRDQIERYLREAIRVHASGEKVELARTPEPVPEELEQVLESDPVLRDAFDSLTPGRQRSYILHVGGAKQASTRLGRAEKCRAKILEGKGFHER